MNNPYWVVPKSTTYSVTLLNWDSENKNMRTYESSLEVIDVPNLAEEKNENRSIQQT